ncbi:hypothetical protein CPAR01_07762 [Colletotrichum paranaense]|uniref:Uncharacterized protein n=1 Tax=Colletotrichum paranaense TaxID=1914294 RepID=A0ABQ9SIB7_9PEZI|nr:uncharacterized protein CPAR01_07762 [Colletotrichum paranaense]KAK1537649.1 hypothetical protein CPAR01_07762 [Colletotrichum paranaense]
MFAYHSAPTGLSGNQPFERYPALHVSITNVEVGVANLTASMEDCNPKRLMGTELTYSSICIQSGLIPKAIEAGKHCTDILSEVRHFLQARIKAIVVSLNATGRNLLPRGLAEIQQRFRTVRHPSHYISLRLR